MTALTCDSVKTYLATLPDDGVAGLAHLPEACPLAECLKYQGFVHPEVNGEEYSYCVPNTDCHEGVSSMLPDWACSFVSKVDIDRKSGDPITVAEARSILEKVCSS